MSPKLSIAAVGIQVRAFLEANWALLLPVVLAFFLLPGLALSLAFPRVSLGQLDLQAVAPWLVLASLVQMFGLLAVLALVIGRRGTSVAEALAQAGRRYAPALGMQLLLGVGVLFLLMVALVLLAPLFGKGAGDAAAAEALAMRAVFILFPLLLWISIRLAPALPALVGERVGPLAALIRGWRLSGGNAAAIFAVLSMLVLGGMLIRMVTSLALGSIVILVARLVGLAMLGDLVVALIGSLTAALVNGVVAVALGVIYCQLAGGRE